MAVKLMNTPNVKIGVVGVSRDCFEARVTKSRLDELVKELNAVSLAVHQCPVIVENETDVLAALQNVLSEGCNAVVVYLGNFGPEGPTTLFIKNFHGPVMVCAAAEENQAVLKKDRGDALCGMLNCSYNLNLRDLRVYIPQMPVGLPKELALKIQDFESIARVVIGVKHLKLFGFGPRPYDFLACNAPLKPFYDLGVEVMENSELDLLRLYKDAAGQTDRIQMIVTEMETELKDGNTYPDLLPKLAQYEIALTNFMEQNLGASLYGAFANKCWPAFEPEFGFTPCYVNSRMAGRGIPIACEVDLYGAMSEYMAQLASMHPATLLDINNSVPSEIVPDQADLKGAAEPDLFMGFHCGNTCVGCMKSCAMKYQLIMNRLMENNGTPDITRGTLEGMIRPGEMTMFRLQAAPDGTLHSYIAEGEFLDIDPRTFGSTGIVAIPGFARFYRHVLITKGFPHHAAIGFKKTGKILFEAVKLLGVDDIGVPLPDTMLYDGENPYELFR